MPIWLAVLVSALGGTTALFGLVATFWRIALPWLRQEIVQPVQETHKQVTVNGGTSDPPTVLDKLAAIDQKIERYFAWSELENQRLWAALHRRQDPPPPSPSR